MGRKGPEICYAWVDPNPPGAVEALLKRILVEKLLAGERDGP